MHESIMHLNHLSLTNFRNYARLELSLPGRLTVIQGANGQGKTNLLEAIHLLATGRSPRATAERELISWLALDGPLPYARLTGDIGAGRTAEKLELVLELAANGGANGPTVRKQVRINGAPVATVLPADRLDRPLPSWLQCRPLAEDELFLLSVTNPASFDSRYFGPVSASAVIGVARPIWSETRP